MTRVQVSQLEHGGCGCEPHLQSGNHDAHSVVALRPAEPAHEQDAAGQLEDVRRMCIDLYDQPVSLLRGSAIGILSVYPKCLRGVWVKIRSVTATTVHCFTGLNDLPCVPRV